MTVVAAATSAGPLLQPASALSTGVAFSAESLPTWQANGVVYAVGQAKGRVFAGGTFTQIRPPASGTDPVQNRSAFAVFNAETGNPDPSCQLNVTLTGGTATVRSIIPSADGSTIYLGGNFSNVGGTSVSRVAAIDATTCAVKPLRVTSISSFVYSLALSGNTLYLGGAFATVGGQPRTQFAAVNATTGALLPFAVTTGLTNRDASVTADGRALAVSPDGTKVALGGEFDTINGADSHSLAVVDATTGANVATYPNNFINRDSVTKSLVTSGNAFYAGNEGTGGGVFDGRFAMDWTTLQQNWRDTCLGATQAVLVYKNTLYSASHAHDCSSMNEFQDGQRNYFNAEPTDTPTLLGWHPQANDGIGEGIGPRALTVATGSTTGKDYLWAAGEFTKVNGVAQQSLTRFGPDDTDAPPTVNVVAEALTSGAIQVRFRSVVDSDDSALTYRVYRNGATTPIWTGTANTLWWVRPQLTFTDTTVTAGTTYTYRVTASDGTNTTALSGGAAAKAVASGSAYAAKIQSDGASFYWRYDETSGTWVQDKSGTTTTGKNGIAGGGPTMGTTGALANDTSKAYTFDGTDDNVYDDQFEPAPTTYTIETWIKTDTTAGGKIIGYGNARPRSDTGDPVLSSNYDRQVYMENGGRIDFGVYTGGTVTVRTTKAYNDNQWHHLVATQGSTGMRLYVDGVLVGKNATTTAQTYSGVWHVGGDNLNSWPNQPTSNYFKGAIDETAVYPTVLSAAQAANHYTLGGGTPATGSAPSDAYGAAVYASDPDLYWRLNEQSGTTAADSSALASNPGAIGSAVTLGQPGQIAGGSAIGTTNNADSLVVSPQQSAPGSFATEFWVKTNTTTGGKIIGYENTSTGNGGNYDKHTYMTSSGQLVFGVYNGSTQTIQTTASYNDNQWHYVVGTQDSSGLNLYVDGQLQGTNSATTNESYNGYWRIGGGNLGGWPSSPSTFQFTGSLDDVAVYSHGLSATEVANHYALGH